MANLVREVEKAIMADLFDAGVGMQKISVGTPMIQKGKNQG